MTSHAVIVRRAVAQRSQACARPQSFHYAEGPVRPLRAFLAFLFAVLMGGAGTHDALLLCRTEQRLHAKCCCKRATLEAAALAAELRRAPCCDEAPLTMAPVPPSSGTHALPAVAPPVLLERRPPPLPILARLDVDAPVLELVRHEATGPPLHIRHRALLL